MFVGDKFFYENKPIIFAYVRAPVFEDGIWSIKIISLETAVQ